MSPLSKKDAPGATPAAEALAEEQGVDLTTVEGSGAEGRVTKSDVEAASSDDATKGAAAVGQDPNLPTVEEVYHQVDHRTDEHPGNLTPGQYAEQKVGMYEGEPGTEEANEHGEKFVRAKMARRLGTDENPESADPLGEPNDT